MYRVRVHITTTKTKTTQPGIVEEVYGKKYLEKKKSIINNTLCESIFYASTSETNMLHTGNGISDVHDIDLS
uniref:Uncharacterized protein n=1 Tax=Glossina brevipalpis TaxID=37001 RepID=A0A1A9WG67_9MUSC